ncbi:MAG: patatin-like phospholipase family protein [Sphaerochaetaceae bacterium]|nr:patatin-like phospholipase family protein [Sphaerochaetaceae bacterium]
MRKFLSFLLLLLFFATAVLPAAEDLAADDIRMADIPIYYGEENFRARILERTQGKRDPIGLVLTGGSARAFAHLGVLKYLEEIGVEPDFIVTNSMGSIIGMLYAAGLSPEQIMRVVNSGELSTFFKVSIPKDGGLVDASCFKGFIQSIVGADLQIEDLPIPCMVISQDMVTKREIRISEGSFADILIASFAIPAYFPPQEYRGHLLIDGGVINLAPIGVAYDYSDTVIVSTSFYDNPDLNLKNLFTVINVGYDIGKRRRAAEDIRTFGEKMIWIRCGVEKFSFMDFAAAGEMMEIGYADAKKESESLSKLYKGGIDPEIETRRTSLESEIERAARNQYFFNRIETKEPFTTWALGMASFQDNKIPFYLNDNMTFGLDYTFRYSLIEAGVKLGFATDITNLMDRYGAVLASSYVYFYPLSNMRLSAYASARHANQGNTLYFRQGYDFKFLNRPTMSFEFNEAFETSYNPSKDLNIFKGNLLLLQFAGHRRFSMMDLKLNLGYLGFKGQEDDTKYRDYIQFSANTRLYLTIKNGLYFDLGIKGRYSFNSKDLVPLFKADGFFVSDKNMSSGLVKLSGKDHFLIVPISFGFDFTKTPTVGEFIIFEDMELSVFADMLFYDDLKASYGVEFQVTPSLIGLQKVPMTMRVGYDSLSQNYFSSIRFTVTK